MPTYSFLGGGCWVLRSLVMFDLVDNPTRSDLGKNFGPFCSPL